MGIKIGNPELRSTEKASIQISIQSTKKENCKCWLFIHYINCMYVSIYLWSALPVEIGGTIPGSNYLIRGATGAALQSQLSAFVDRFVNQAEEVVFILLFIFAVLIVVMDCVPLGQGLVLIYNLFVNCLERRPTVQLLTLTIGSNLFRSACRWVDVVAD